MDLQELETAIDQASGPEAIWLPLVGFLRGRGLKEIATSISRRSARPDAHLHRISNDGFPRNGSRSISRPGPGRDAGGDLCPAERRAGLLGRDRRPQTAQPGRAGPSRGAAPVGLGLGLVVPVFGPNGRNGLFGLGLPEDLTRLPVEDLRAVSWACQAAHLRYCALPLPLLGGAAQPVAARIRGAGLVARGKSNATIGSILGISTHTVDAHLRRISSQARGVRSISAALQGLGFGLIQSDG